jgi:hypothetical protein
MRKLLLLLLEGWDGRLREAVKALRQLRTPTAASNHLVGVRGTHRA